MAESKSTWLITGANGFLGSNAPRYLSPGLTLVAATRSGSLEPGFTRSVSLDLSRTQDLEAQIRVASPSVILHAAALANHEQCETDRVLAHRINTVATARLAALAESLGAQFVYVSTDAVFDGAHGNYAETDQVSPFSVYGETKYAGEIAALAETDALIIRTNFFGWSPSGERSILEFFVNNLAKGTLVNGYTDFIVTSIYAGDLLEQIESLVNADAHGIFHLASSDALSKFDFGVTVARQFGLDASLISPRSASSGAHDTSRVRNLSLNTDLVTSTLGYPMPSQVDGIIRAKVERLA